MPLRRVILILSLSFLLSQHVLTQTMDSYMNAMRKSAAA